MQPTTSKGTAVASANVGASPVKRTWKGVVRAARLRLYPSEVERIWMAYPEGVIPTLSCRVEIQ